MADTYSKLLGLSGAPTLPSAVGKAKPVQAPTLKAKNTPSRANQHTSKAVGHQTPQKAPHPAGTALSGPAAPAPRPGKTLDTSVLTTKEKTKYGTYLTDESIEKISIRAIQLKRDAHQIVQEAVNQYFERLEKQFASKLANQ
jgi:hypothetical protein